MRRHAPFDPTDLNVCMWGGVVDVINCAKFFENPSTGLGAVRPRKIAFPIEIVHRPYNSVGTTVPNCDKYKDSVLDCQCCYNKQHSAKHEWSLPFDKVWKKVGQNKNHNQSIILAAKQIIVK